MNSSGTMLRSSLSSVGCSPVPRFAEFLLDAFGFGTFEATVRSGRIGCSRRIRRFYLADDAAETVGGRAQAERLVVKMVKVILRQALSENTVPEF
jgi:hypothetical protein